MQPNTLQWKAKTKASVDTQTIFHWMVMIHYKNVILQTDIKGFHPLVLRSAHADSIKLTTSNNYQLIKFLTEESIPFWWLFLNFFCPLKRVSRKKLNTGRWLCCNGWRATNWLVKNTVLQTLRSLALTADMPNPWEDEVSWVESNYRIYIILPTTLSSALSNITE